MKENTIETIVMLGAIVAVTYAAMEMLPDVEVTADATLVNASGNSNDGTVGHTLQDWFDKMKAFLHGKH